MLHTLHSPATSQAVTKPAHHRQHAVVPDASLDGTTRGAIVDDDYILFETLGRGGMGEVRRAADLKRGRVVAIKSMHRSLACKPQLVAQFRNEGDMVASVSHRNVVTLLGRFDQADRHYLVFEHIRGRSLRDCITNDAPFTQAQQWSERAHARSGAQQWSERAHARSGARFNAIAQQLTSAVAAVHRAGIVHGDIKSGNVLISPGFVDDRVTLIDFGLAHRTTPSFEIDRGISGTPGYMAPELLSGELSTQASDQYALGVVLYEMLTGVHPFERECAAGEAPLDGDFHWQPTAPSTCAPTRNIAPILDQVVLRMMAKQPADRFANLTELQHAAPWRQC